MTVLLLLAGIVYVLIVFTLLILVVIFLFKGIKLINKELKE